MLLASVVSLVLAAVSAFGLGGIVGAFANHFFAQRREMAAEQRALATSARKEDRAELLTLFGLINALENEIGARRSPYSGSLRENWGPTEHKRAQQFADLYDKYIDKFEAVERALQDKNLSDEINWMVRLIMAATVALSEGEPSPAADLVHEALRRVNSSASSFLSGLPHPPNDLRTAWEEERAAFYDAQVHAASDSPLEKESPFMRRVSERWRELEFERRAARRKREFRDAEAMWRVLEARPRLFARWRAKRRISRIRRENVP